MAAPDTAPDDTAPETAEVPGGRIARIGALLLGVVAAVLLLSWGTLRLLDRWDVRPASSPLARQTLEAPEPRLQTDEAADLARLRAAEDAELHRLAWVDRKAGLARIPIEDAMDLLARDGWP
ncbi:hypothetical protein ACIU1J_05795 [Azospirillum doebereinerae]|uniref:hypothetical protein n=1 Tax=Azospirillum doebereinerae TaxID=92933 RepID=UPI001EE5229E|nr:hypothetical protein [Azospirillum doebereinerae]MCG5239727.1 hypothetical protein [Azospirillum doebereinerae]